MGWKMWSSAPSFELDVLGAESAPVGLDGAQLIPDRLEVSFLEHLGVLGGVVGVLWEEVPSADDQLLQPGHGEEVADEGRTVLGSLAEPDGRALGERARQIAQPAATEQDADDGSRRDRTEPEQ